MRKAHFKLSRACTLLVLLLFSSFSYAQFNASLSGTVADPTGAVIPGATVTLKSNATQAIRTATSGSQGTYQFSELPPGDYSLTGAAKVFRAPRSTTLTSSLKLLATST